MIANLLIIVDKKHPPLKIFFYDCKTFADLFEVLLTKIPQTRTLNVSGNLVSVQIYRHKTKMYSLEIANFSEL